MEGDKKAELPAKPDLGPADAGGNAPASDSQILSLLLAQQQQNNLLLQEVTAMRRTQDQQAQAILLLMQQLAVSREQPVNRGQQVATFSTITSKTTSSSPVTGSSDGAPARKTTSFKDVVDSQKRDGEPQGRGPKGNRGRKAPGQSSGDEAPFEEVRRSRPGPRERSRNPGHGPSHEYRGRDGNLHPRREPKKKDARVVKLKNELREAVTALREHGISHGYAKGQIVKEDAEQATLLDTFLKKKSEYKRIRAYFTPDSRLKRDRERRKGQDDPDDSSGLSD